MTMPDADARHRAVAREIAKEAGDECLLMECEDLIYAALAAAEERGAEGARAVAEFAYDAGFAQAEAMLGLNTTTPDVARHGCIEAAIRARGGDA